MWSVGPGFRKFGLLGRYGVLIFWTQARPDGHVIRLECSKRLGSSKRNVQARISDSAAFMAHDHNKLWICESIQLERGKFLLKRIYIHILVLQRIGTSSITHIYIVVSQIRRQPNSGGKSQNYLPKRHQQKSKKGKILWWPATTGAWEEMPEVR